MRQLAEQAEIRGLMQILQRRLDLLNPPPVPLDSIAVALLKLRRSRDAMFPAGIFGEAVWDILLDLFVAEASAREISVTSACIASAVPSTTALRWLTVLQQKELIFRLPDPQDRRRSIIGLTPAARAAMERVLATWRDPMLRVQELASPGGSFSHRFD